MCCSTYKGCPDAAITYRKGKPLLVRYGDASFAADPDTQKSTTVYIFMMRGAPVSFGTVTQTLTAQSTVEDELIALNYTAREAVYLSNLLEKIGLGTKYRTIPINSDNTGALLLDQKHRAEVSTAQGNGGRWKDQRLLKEHNKHDS